LTERTFLFTFLCASYVHAQSVTFSIPKNLTATPGATSVKAPVNVTDLTGLGVISGELTVSYDTNVLTATGVMTKDTIAQGGMAPYNIDDTNGTIRIAMVSATPFAGGGVLIFILFDVDSANLNDGSQLEFTQVRFNSGKVSANADNGKITLVSPDKVTITTSPTPPPIETEVVVSIPEDLKVPTDTASVQVPVNVSNLTGLGVISANLIVIYDFNVLEATGATLNGTIAEGGTLFANPDNANGTIRIGLIFSEKQKPALSGSGVLVYINFNVKSDIPDDDSHLSIVQASFNSASLSTTKLDSKIIVNTLPMLIRKIIKANTYYQLKLFNLTLTIPAGAITEDKTLEAEIATNAPPLLGGLHATNLTYDLRFYDSDMPGEISSAFAQPLLLTFHYQDGQAPPNVGEESLHVYGFDTQAAGLSAEGVSKPTQPKSQENEHWKFIGGTVDTQNNTVTAEIDYLSTYNLLAGYAYGDVSGDGQISAIDAALVLQKVVSIIGELPPQHILSFRPPTADVSGNGKISAFDASMILRKAVGLPPHPWHSERHNFPVLEKSP